MLLVVLLTAVLSDPSDSSSSPPSPPAASWTEKLGGALIDSLIFVVVITVVTFLLVLLFYLRWTAFLRYYMGFSSFLVLVFMGGELSALLLRRFDLPLDCATFALLLFNFAAVGAVAVLAGRGVVPILLTQGYLVVIGVLVAFWFTMLPEWTTWALLIAMALYDLAAVLLPVGPLRLLVELAISRDEEIPALVYEARPVVDHHQDDAGGDGRRLWRHRRDPEGGDPDSSLLPAPETMDDTESPGSALRTPLLASPLERMGSEDLDGIGLGSSGAIKLGLGDFIFYSVLVGRAAMYDFTTVYACYLAIIAGLGATLLLLAFFRRALPALPISIALGVVFYLLTRFLLEEFLVQCSVNLVMF
ncbi:unnamed protein product [Spirodela intermedia]|uniref:Presenilin n=1 Tax=Spirodela intermedia TaxID=51605 RepID=A0A7I8JQV3_SPIIN|nr:unnamed protein product [Spirodela intermedia]CAA6671963.1 unnamed protein product [Spirodela intermedia]